MRLEFQPKTYVSTTSSIMRLFRQSSRQILVAKQFYINETLIHNENTFPVNLIQRLSFPHQSQTISGEGKLLMIKFDASYLTCHLGPKSFVHPVFELYIDNDATRDKFSFNLVLLFGRRV